MPTRLYLDTARLGLASSSAQRAHRDFARLAGEEGLALYSSRLLWYGFNAWPASLQSRYSGLRHWNGVHDLKDSLRGLAGLGSDEQPVLLASRTAQLMRLAARLLFSQCRRVLITDLTWPSYSKILEQERVRSGAEIMRMPVRSPILHDRLSSKDFARRIAVFYRSFKCDGLFLPAVSHDGIRLPVDRLSPALSEGNQIRLFVVDGAQAFGHVPTDLSLGDCDFYIAGCHKWLRAQHPMGLAFCPSERSRGMIRTTCTDMVESGELDDPLMRFINELEGDWPAAFSETVDAVPLFSCRAALADLATRKLADSFRDQLANAEILAGACAQVGWRALLPDRAFRSGILLLQADSPLVRCIPPTNMQAFFQAYGIALTCYEDGALRLSMPTTRWKSWQLDLICSALADCAKSREISLDGRSPFPTGELAGGVSV